MHQLALAAPLALILVLASPAWGFTYFTDATRPDDSASCVQARTLATAKKTIAAGVACANTSGDILEVVGTGTSYTEAVLTAFTSGAIGNPITIRGRLNADGTYDLPIWCLTGHAPSVDVQSEPVWDMSSISNVTIGHFEYCQDVSVRVRGSSSNIIIERSTFDGRPGLTYTNGGNNPSIIEVNCTKGAECQNITVRYNTIKGTFASTCTPSCNSLDFAHVYGDRVIGYYIYGNDFKNTASGPWGNGVFLKHSGSTWSVYQNFFDNIDKSCFNGTEGETAGTGVGMVSISFYQNVCWGNLANGGVQLSAPNNVNPVSDLNTWNNTFYSPTGAARCFLPNFATGKSLTGAFQFYNNICRFDTGASQRYVSQDGAAINASPIWDYNNYSRATSGSDDGSRLVRAGSACSGGCTLANWQGLSDTPDLHSTADISTHDPHLSSVGSSTATSYKSTDTAGTGVWVAGKLGGLSSGISTAVGAYINASDQIGVPNSTGGSNSIGGGFVMGKGLAL